MDETLPKYEVEEISLEELVLMLASEDEKHNTDFSKASARALEYLAA